jgi:hypothetical protein
LAGRLVNGSTYAIRSSRLALPLRIFTLSSRRSIGSRARCR